MSATRLVHHSREGRENREDESKKESATSRFERKRKLFSVETEGWQTDEL